MLVLYLTNYGIYSLMHCFHSIFASPTKYARMAEFGRVGIYPAFRLPLFTALAKVQSYGATRSCTAHRAKRDLSSMSGTNQLPWSEHQIAPSRAACSFSANGTLSHNLVSSMGSLFAGNALYLKVQAAPAKG